MTYNVDDLASYLTYQSIISAGGDSNIVNETTPGSAGALFSDTVTSAISLTDNANVKVDGQSTWSVNPLDLLADPPPTFTYTATNNLSNTNDEVIIPAAAYTTSSSTTQNLGTVANFSTDPNVVSIADLSAFYQANGFLAGSAQWDDVSGNGTTFPSTSSSLTSVSNFWTGNATNNQILNFWIDIQSANGVYTKSAPPTTLEGFLQAMESVKLVPTTAATAQGLTPGVTGSTASLTTTAGLVLTPSAAPTASTSSQIFSGLLGSFIANYNTYFPNTTNATITPEQFATQFETFVQTDLASVLANTPININVDDGSGGVQLKQITASSVVSGNIGSSITFPADFATQFASDLLSQYTSALQVSTDWQGVTPPSFNVTTNFNKSFDYFLDQVTSSSSPLVSQGSNFFTMWSEFVGPSTFLQNASGAVPNELTTYQQLYNLFYPDQPQLFASRLSAFIQDALNAPAGVFNPSLLIDQWFAKLQTGFNNLTTTLDAAGFSQVQIINQVFNNLIDVINDLQNMTLAQAGRLNFYSEYSQAYTNEIYNVPFLLPSDGTPVDLAANPATFVASGTGDGNIQTITSPAVQAATFRQQGDTAANQWVQNIQNYRTEVDQNGQNQQTTVQTTDSALNQQTNFATSILQILNQLIQSIFNSNSASGSSAP